MEKTDPTTILYERVSPIEYLKENHNKFILLTVFINVLILNHRGSQPTIS